MFLILFGVGQQSLPDIIEKHNRNNDARQAARSGAVAPVNGYFSCFHVS